MNDKAVVLNEARVNYDGKVDMSHLTGQVTVYKETEEEQAPARAEGCTIVVTKEMPLSAATIDRLPDTVKLIAEAGTGYNNIDLEAAAKRGITVCNVPSYSSQRVAHTVLLLMLELASSMQRQHAMLSQGDISNFTQYLQVDHVELNGKTLGIIGLGHIGHEVAKVAHAMEMQVLAYNNMVQPDEDGIHFVSLEELLKQSDFVTLHCPLMESTYHLIDERALELMKPSAFLVNTARGALIDQSALVKALQQHRIAGAGLDVLEQEPPMEHDPIFQLDNVVLTPHMGWKGLETRQRLVDLLTKNIQQFLAGSPINVVTR